MNGSDHLAPQPCSAASWPRPNALQDDYDFGVDVARGAPRRAARRRPPRLVRRAALRRARQRAHGRRVEPGRRAPGGAAAERALERTRRAARARCSCRPTDYPDVAPRHRVAQPRAEQRARLVVCVQRRRGGRRGASCATRRRATSATALTREALRRWPPRSTRRPAPRSWSTPPPPTAAASSPSRCPGEGPVHLVADRRRLAVPTQLVRHDAAARGSRTVVVGRKVAWVLEMMRGPEFAGARITRVDRREAAPDDVGSSPSWRRAGRPAARPRRGPRGAPRARRRWRDDPVPSAAGADRARCSSRTHAGPRLRLAHASRAVDGEGPGTTVRAGGGTLDNEHLTRRGRSGRRHARDPHHGRRGSIAGLDRLVDGGDGGDTYNYSPPADDTIVDRPDLRARRRTVETGPVRARLLVERTYELPGRRDRRRARLHRTERRAGARRDLDHARAPRRRTVRARPRRHRQPGA